METQFVNIRLLLDRLIKHPLLKDITLESVISYTADFISIVGLPNTLNEKITTLDIIDHRALLPCDFYNMIQIRYNGRCFKYSSDSFHCNNHHSDLIYKIKGNIIHTSLKKGCIEISYRAIMVDDEGFPLLPDNSTFIIALENYIKVKEFNILLDLGKISQQSFHIAQQNYAFSVGQCQTDLIRPSLDQMESLSQMWIRLLPNNTSSHYNGFYTYDKK